MNNAIDDVLAMLKEMRCVSIEHEFSPDSFVRYRTTHKTGDLRSALDANFLEIAESAKPVSVSCSYESGEIDITNPWEEGPEVEPEWSDDVDVPYLTATLPHEKVVPNAIIEVEWIGAT